MYVLLSGRGVEVMKEDKDDFSSRYKIKDNTRKDEYPFETFPRIGLCVIIGFCWENMTYHKNILLEYQWYFCLQ